MSTIDEVKSRMKESLEAVRREFSTIRTGKATPSILDTVRVEAYGGRVPLNQVASVNTPESTLLMVQPFDRSLIPDIERAILQADLGLNPSNDGAVIRIPIPPLTEERRREYVKVLTKMAEEGRVSVRHARRDGNDEIKALVKEGELSDDEGRRAQEEIQRLTDQFIGRIDEALEVKEKEIMTV
ncbi:MAG: ribosome recycling factor [Gemmatimonadales bacterium]|nr:MAG: ribosome recycling factor [Gemmatimonadales bacterium]